MFINFGCVFIVKNKKQRCSHKGSIFFVTYKEMNKLNNELIKLNVI